ncbi:hypothetical protein MB901379_03087 [Mycobacterium basiliense]|uniref:DUF732 domain-containing protein n=1 Tax=Mycobacterium basiliense TaxID=2094119 RepID=A0A3S4BXD1_9MYCO|nr:DUF732 domain-containing protein [Mycobacterium basiliense]VDM89510.1 hypothetical protein MB901379_03087 [Mycobacterium basiliense]
MKFVTAMAAICASIALALPAHAERSATSGDDASFLAALQQIGITYPSSADAIGAAHAVCICLDNGESGLSVIQEVKTRNPEFDMDAAAHFAVISARHYCPHHLFDG